MVSADIGVQFQNRNHKDECVAENFIFVIINRNAHITVQRIEQIDIVFLWGRGGKDKVRNKKYNLEREILSWLTCDSTFKPGAMIVVMNNG